MQRGKLTFVTYIILTVSVSLFAQTTWNVPVGGNIQDAVNNANSGDTIQLAAGTYIQQVHINKNNIRLTGVGNSTVIESPVSLSLSFNYGWTIRPVIFVDGVTGVTIDNLTVDGAGRGATNNRFAGIAYWNAGGVVESVLVTRVRENPYNGNQHGYGVIARNNTGGPYTLIIKNSKFTDIQKNGIYVLDSGLTATIQNNTVTGHGANNMNASNGIVATSGSNVTITGNTVNNYHYTGASWTSSGIIVMSGTSGTVNNNRLNSVQAGIYVMDAGPVTVDSNRINMPSNSGGIYFGGIAIGEYYSGGSSFNVVVSNNQVTGNGLQDSIGFDIFANTGNVNLTGGGNTITNFDYGIYSYEYSQGSLTGIALNGNNIVGNISYGAYNAAVANADLLNNWWGSCSGPSGVGPGTGDAVSAGILYDPWGCLGANPVAVIDAMPEAGLIPRLDTNLSGLGSHDSDGVIVSWQWRLGDGSSASGPEVFHSYYTEGKSIVNLTVTDNSGQQGTARKEVSLYDPAKLEFLFDVDSNPIILRANGEEYTTIAMKIIDKTTGEVILLDFGLEFQTSIGTMVGEVIFNPETGIYTQTLKSGEYGDDTITAVINGTVLDSVSARYEWPLSPMDLLVEDVVDRSLFKGQWYKKISWSDNPQQHYEISKYRIYKSKDGRSWVLTGEVDSGKNSFIDGGLSEAADIYYAVTSVDSFSYESEKETAK